MNSFSQAAVTRPHMSLQMPTTTAAPAATMMMQPTTARFDASAVPETSGPLRPGPQLNHSYLQRIQATVTQQMPDLALAHKQGRLTPQQQETMSRIIKGMYATMVREEANRDQTAQTLQGPPQSASHSGSPALNAAVNLAGPPGQPIRVETPQQQLNMISSPASAVGQNAPLSAVGSAPGPPTPVAGVKRKTPPPSSQIQNTHLPPGPPANDGARTQRSKDSEGESGESLAPPEDPGPQPWPNSVGSRPTLTGGLGGSSLILSTPAHIVFPQIDPEALEAALLPRRSTSSTNAAAEAARKESTSGLGGLGSKKTIREIVATIDPRVRVDAEVDDFMLELADEFIDSAIHFACRIAQHRGSETLEVRDLQLHLESNLNLRIPGFSSDETRVSISQSAMVGDVLLGAVGAGKSRPGGGASTTANGAGGGTTKSKGKGSKEKGTASKESAANEKEREAALGRGLRAARMAAVRAARKGS